MIDVVSCQFFETGELPISLAVHFFESCVLFVFCVQIILNEGIVKLILTTFV